MRLRRLAGVLVAAGVLLALTLALLVPEARAMLDAHHADPVKIDLDPLAQRSLVLAADGRTTLAVLHAGLNRKVVPLSDMPPVLVATVLSVEDAQFFEHGGLDVKSLVRALFANVRSGGVREGGSTITQQLVKNALLTSHQDLDRKLKEAVLAVRLEHQLTKEQILERYLNTVYLGNGTYGVQAAAELYFGKDVQALDRAESALLAGLIQNPVNDDPFTHPDAARRRRAVVVQRLRSVHAIDDGTAYQMLLAPLPSAPKSLLPKPDDYFVNEVVQQLLRDDHLGATPTARYNALFEGGLTIRTTLDVRDQQAAKDAIAAKLPNTGGAFTAALVSVDPTSGAVRSLVGGPGFEQSRYDIATQGAGRQVGSSMKPFVLAAAVEQGISPHSRILGSSPCRFDNPTGTPNPYIAENYEGEGFGTVDLFDATAHSVNCAYLRLGQIVGLNVVVDVAHRLGITASLAPNLSLPLGTSEIRPIDMAAAYATFAADGVYHQPYVVEEVRDSFGSVLLHHEPVSHRAVSPDVAHTVTDVLRGVVTHGTGTAAALPDNRPVVGKTGTTAEHADAWFVGYTPQLATAVWMGSPTGRVEMRNVAGVPVVTGGTFPAQIWSAYMGAALAGTPAQDFPPPPDMGPGRYLSQTDAGARSPTTSAPAPGNGSGGGPAPSSPGDAPRKGKHH